MIKNEIAESPRLLFLGAGASKPLGKMLMGEFVEYLMKQTSNEPYAELIRVICRENQDLEFLIEQLEEISSKRYFGNVHTFRRGDGETFSFPAMSSEVAKLAALADGALQWVKREVYHHYRNLDPQARIGLLDGIVDRMRTAPGCSVVFTTNYDPSIETLCRNKRWRLVDGFEHDALLQQYSWNRNVFDTFRSTAEPTTVLFKIHGSTNWISDSGRLVKSVSIHATEAEDGFQNAMIYPATKKVAILEPYFTCYDYLGKCLSHAEFCLVIGYSFRDYDVLVRFRAAAISNEKLRVAILDPSAQKLCDKISQYGINASPIIASLGDKPDAYETAINKVLNSRTRKRRRRI
ncbi:MAG: SIR2 family protein [Terracidiphilus sp.]|jgi:hypothetical protein